MISTLSLSVLGIALMLALLLAVELGFRGRRFAYRRSPDSKPPEMDFLLSAAMGLLALLLGFTFSLALGRHEERRDLVIAEANAIGTSWLRIQAIDEPARGQLSRAYADYAQTRLAWSLASETSEGGQAALARGNALQAQLWPVALEALRTSRGVVDAKTLLDPLNESFDLAAERVARRDAHLPDALIVMLFLYLLISAGMTGWRLAADGHRAPVASSLTMLLLTLAVVATLDLDRAREGLIDVSQQPMRDAIAAMKPAS